MSSRLPLPCRAVAAALLACLVCGPARAQNQGLSVYFAERPDPAAQGVANVLLRPNTEAPYFLFVKNTAGAARTVTVILSGGAGPEKRELARAAGVAVPAGGVAPVAFKADDKPVAVPGLRVELRLLDETGKDVPLADETAAPQLKLQVPNAYTAADPAFTGARGTPAQPEKNELRVTVSLNAPVAGPAVKVKLDMSRVPGLLLDSLVDGAFEGEIPAGGGKAILVARDMLFAPGPAEPGWVAVTVDGYERAWLFETTFERTSTPQAPRGENVITIASKAYAKPGDPYPVRLEIDQPRPANPVVEFGFDKSGTGTYETRRFPGDRERAVTVKLAGPGGAVVFGTVVKDWTFPLDTAGVLGPRKLRARLLTPKPGAPAGPPEYDEVKARDKVVWFDNTPPAVRLTAPREHARGTPLRLTATAVDRESLIDRVLFFVGDPPAPDVRAAVRGKVILADRDAAGGTFSAVLNMADVKGPAYVGVRAVNGAGLATDATAEVLLVDPPTPPAKPTTGAVKGVIVQGEPARPQKQRPVMLLDEKQSAVVKTTETNDKGEFMFKEVAPGNYVVRSDKPKDYALGRKAVTVVAGETTDAKDVVVKRTPSPPIPPPPPPAAKPPA